jgi:hypothetical protein
MIFRSFFDLAAFVAIFASAFFSMAAHSATQRVSVLPTFSAFEWLPNR